MASWLEKILEEFGYKGYAVTSGEGARKMNDPISREATIKLILSGKVGYDSLVECPEECNSMLVWAADEVAKMPTIDPMRHGRWDKDSIAFYWRCSECGAIVKSNLWDVFLDPFSSHRDLNYCPHCGAKMKGEEDE